MRDGRVRGGYTFGIRGARGDGAGIVESAKQGDRLGEVRDGVAGVAGGRGVAGGGSH